MLCQAGTDHPDGWRWWFGIGWRGVVYGSVDALTLIGTVMANSATVLTGNPIGAFLTHTPMHVAAVVHQHEGGQTQMLPPKETADYPSHGDSDLAAGLAVLWLLGTAGALTLLVRRQRTSQTRNGVS